MKGISSPWGMGAKILKSAAGIILVSVMLSCANQGVLDKGISPSQEMEAIELTQKIDLKTKNKSNEKIASLIVAANDENPMVREKAILALEETFEGEQYLKKISVLFTSDAFDLEIKLKMLELLFSEKALSLLKEMKHEIKDIYEKNPSAEIAGRILAGILAEEKFLSKHFIFQKPNKSFLNNSAGLIEAAVNVLLLLGKNSSLLEEEDSILILRKIIFNAKWTDYEDVGANSSYKFGRNYLKKVINHFGEDQAVLYFLLTLGHELGHNFISPYLKYKGLERQSGHELLATLLSEYLARIIDPKGLINDKRNKFLSKGVPSTSSRGYSDPHDVAIVMIRVIREELKQKGQQLEEGVMFRLGREILKEQSKKNIKFKFLPFIDKLKKRYEDEMKKTGNIPMRIASSALIKGIENIDQKQQRLLSEKENSITDSAMLVEKESSFDGKHTKGGIDLNTSQLEIESQGEKIEKFKFPFSALGIPCFDEDGDGICDTIDSKTLGNMNINGFSPIIFQIKALPTANFFLLLGFGGEKNFIENEEEGFDVSLLKPKFF